MPLTVVDHPAIPECRGSQWSVADEVLLAELTALVLLGRARHVAQILKGAQKVERQVGDALKNCLYSQLHPTTEPGVYHRDGLLFEIITWLIASMQASDSEVVSDPHLVSTQQGIDTIKVRIDEVTFLLEEVTIFEQKCTENPRQQFKTKVLPSFDRWIAGDFDNKLTQLVLGLLASFNLDLDQELAIMDRLLLFRPLSFRAALTVVPNQYDTVKCLALFESYSNLAIEQDKRFGDTLPLVNVRGWFNQFSEKVWQKIVGVNV